VIRTQRLNWSEKCGLAKENFSGSNQSKCSGLGFWHGKTSCHGLGSVPIRNPNRTQNLEPLLTRLFRIQFGRLYSVFCTFHLQLQYLCVSSTTLTVLEISECSNTHHLLLVAIRINARHYSAENVLNVCIICSNQQSYSTYSNQRVETSDYQLQSHQQNVF